MEKTASISENTLLGKSVRLFQLITGHRAGTDAVLLAAAIPQEGSLIDVGAATGAVGLMASYLNKNRKVQFLEQNPDLADLCRKNIILNGLTDAHVITASLFDKKELSEQGIAPLRAQIVATNPPFFEPNTVIITPDRQKAAAHVLDGKSLQEWIDACIRLIQPKGFLCMIHRADRIGDILTSISKAFGGTQIRFIHPRDNEPATRVVIRCKKGARAPLRIELPLILHQSDGEFTEEAQALHQGTKKLFNQ